MDIIFGRKAVCNWCKLSEIHPIEYDNNSYGLEM